MKRRFSAAFFLGILLGLGGETLLLSERASSRFSEILQKDFHALLFIRADASSDLIEDIKHKLAAIPGEKSVHFISQKESLSFLKTTDPGISRALSFFSNNPMDPAFEVSFSSEGLRSFPDWLRSAKTVANWTDARYQEGELNSILRLELYVRFLGVALTALLCVVAAIGALGVFIPLAALLKQGGERTLILFSLIVKTWAMACLGAAFGAAFSGFFALPLVNASPWWNWPSPLSQCLLLISAALASGALCAW